MATLFFLLLFAAVATVAILCRIADRGSTLSYQRNKLREIRNNALVERMKYK